MSTKFRATLVATLLCAFAVTANAQLTEPQLQTCPTATKGAPTTPWIQCAGGIKFAPISDSALVATGDFNQGAWQAFSEVSGETMVAICPTGAVLENETRCRTADGTNWATRFVRKDTLPGLARWQVTYRWNPVNQYDDGAPITTPVAYVLTWYGTDAAGTPTTPNTDVETAGPPLLVSVPQQRVCARLRSKVSGVLSEPSPEVCITPSARKPGIPTGVTVEFGEP